MMIRKTHAWYVIKIAMTCLALFFVHCADTGQDVVSIPLYVSGSELEQPILTDSGDTLTIDTLQLAFGPLYLCAGVTAGDLCDSARLEWLDSVVIDLLSAEPVRVGALTGTTGPVQSYMYDLGISSQLTSQSPFVLEAARSLGDASLLLKGSVTLSGNSTEIPIELTLPIAQTGDTELGIPIIRGSSQGAISQEVTSSQTGLWLRFDANTWFEPLDLNSYINLDDAQPLRSLRATLLGRTRPVIRWDFKP